MPRRSLSLETARRIALSAQGMDRARPNGRVGLGQVRKIIRTLGLLQIDYVNVLVPAHYMVLFSRLGPYDRSLLDRLLSSSTFLCRGFPEECEDGNNTNGDGCED